MNVADWLMLMLAFGNAAMGAWHAAHHRHLKASSYFHMSSFGLLLIILSQVLRR